MVTTLPGPSQFRGWMTTTLLAFTLVFAVFSSYGQCLNLTQFPLSPTVASSFNDTVLVSTGSFAGDFFRVTGLTLNRSYTFLSSNPAGFITIRNANTNEVLGQGTVPFSYNVGSGPDVVAVHLNLAVGCGTQAVDRTTRFVCTTCDAPAGRVGVNTTSPRATLEVGGEILVGNVQRPPAAGMIRWNAASSDFEGYNGVAWISLTKSNTTPGQWGQVASAIVQENNKVTASDGIPEDNFGYSVSIQGNYAIVGSPFADLIARPSQGAAYIFVRNGNNWSQQAKLIASDGNSEDVFGISVSIDGDYAVIGAPLANIGGNIDQGAVYVFVRNGTVWTQQAKLVAADGAAQDRFGISAKISGSDIIVGSLDDIGANVDQGSAYIFTRNGTAWTQQAKLVASDGAANDNFGSERGVSINGNYAVVGAALDDVGSVSNQGSAYVFFRTGTTWTQQAKLTAVDGVLDDRFGTAVDISGSNIIIGAPRADIGTNTDQGAAYAFSRAGTTWNSAGKVTASTGASDMIFGVAVSISGSNMIVSAPSENTNGNSFQGSAYLFSRQNNQWIFQSKVVPSFGQPSQFFGNSVGISGGDAILGASLEDIGTNTNEGAVYFIKRN